MIGDTPYGVVARRTGPSRVATLRGRATHAPGARQPQSHRLGSSSVVDVLVIFSDKFQQSSRTCSRRCTGFSSSTVLDLPVVHRRRGTHSVTVQKTDEIPQMQFLDKVVNTPVGVQIFDNVADVFVVQAWRWSRRAENCGVPQLQFSDKADMPVVVNDRCWEVQIQFIADLQTFQFATETETHSANCAAGLGAVHGGWGGDEGFFFGLFSFLFALRPSGR